MNLKRHIWFLLTLAAIGVVWLITPRMLRSSVHELFFREALSESYIGPPSGRYDPPKIEVEVSIPIAPGAAHVRGSKTTTKWRREEIEGWYLWTPWKTYEISVIRNTIRLAP